MRGAPSVGDEPILVSEELHHEMKRNLHKRKGIPAYIPAYEERQKARKSRKTSTSTCSSSSIKEPALPKIVDDETLSNIRRNGTVDQQGLIVQDLITSREKLEQDNQYLRRELEDAKRLIRELRHKMKKDGHHNSQAVGGSVPLFSMGRKIGNSLAKKTHKHRRSKPLLFGGKKTGAFHNPVEPSLWGKLFESGPSKMLESTSPATPKRSNNNNKHHRDDGADLQRQSVRQVFPDIDGAPPPPVLDVEIRRMRQSEGELGIDLAHRLAESVTIGSSDSSTATATSSLSDKEPFPKKRVQL